MNNESRCEIENQFIQYGWKSKLRNVDQDEFIPEYYRCDDIQRINIGKVLSTLEKIANA